MAICLFSYLGVETAGVAAGKVREPERNVPGSTVFGTLASAAVYIRSLAAVFGILPASELAKGADQASYSAAANTVAGGTWLGYIVAAAVIVSGIGALNGSCAVERHPTQNRNVSVSPLSPCTWPHSPSSINW